MSDEERTKEEIELQATREFKELVRLIKPLVKHGAQPTEEQKSRIFYEMDAFKQWNGAMWQYQEQLWRDALAFLEKKRTERMAADKGEATLSLPQLAQNLANKTGFLAAARSFIQEQPVYFDKNRLWWLWNKETTRWEITDETDILNIVTTSMQLYGDVSVKHRNLLIEALRQEGRKSRPKDFPKNWIQFRDRVYDLETGNTYPATPEFFCVNPIPWRIGASEDTPTISRLFDDWVGPEYTQTLYEIIAYHCYADYPIHVIFCLVGNGRNGKSKFQELIQRFIGKDNLCSTELENIFENRFETFKLYKKLGCSMGETNFDTIRNTSLLKKLCGQDLIGYEAKNKDPFDDYNYAKIVISSNSLPTSEDTSDGFYRRWLIINFPREFPEGKNIIDTIPLQEYDNLARKVTKILPELLRLGKFRNQGTIEERKQRYIEASNPLMIFIKTYCIEDSEASMLYSSLYTKYVTWLSSNKRRAVSRKEFSEALEREGLEIKKTTILGENGRFIIGVKFKTHISDFEKPQKVTEVPDVTQVAISPIPIRANLNYEHIGHFGHTGAINAVYDSSLGGETPNFPNFHDVLDTLRSLNSVVSLEELEKLYPGEVRLSSWLDKLSEDGQIFSPRPGFWRAL